MQADSASTASNPPGNALPPVVPPSGRHIVQLFVVPGLIVAGVVVVVLGCGGLLNLLFGVGFSRSTKDFLSGLENSNPDVRWRAASDLAQVLKRDDKLAADPELGLKLDELLNRSLDDMNRDERSFADRTASLSRKDQEHERESLQSQRSYVQFLSACLGNMSLPLGVPSLTRMALNEKGPDPKTIALLRRHAVWCLANLGESRKRFAKLPAVQREAVLAQLLQEADSASGTRGRLARQTLDVLQGKERPNVIGPLAECAKADDPFLRQMTAFALNFWDGTPAENALAAKTLAVLAKDRGQGERIEVGEAPAPMPSPNAQVSRAGWEIRYNAVTALARRGSEHVQDYFEVLAEMLDEDQQLVNFRTKLKDGRDVPDEQAAHSTVVSALKAVAELHEKKPGLDLSALNPAIDKLTQSGNLVVRNEAERTRIALGKS